MKFSLGNVVSTPGALDAIPMLIITACLLRHQQGIWGDVCEEDREANERALKDGDRIFSVYHGPDGTKFYIITEWDRSYTTVLLPSEY